MQVQNVSRLLSAGLCALACAVLLGCGGGGSSTTSSSSTSGTTGSTPGGTTTTTPVISTPGTTSTTSTTVTTPTVATLSGVASSGTPLLGAALRIIDASGARLSLLDAAGNRVDRLRTSTADGSFRIQLATPTASLPLLVQAAGVDGTGQPVLVHSTLNTTTLPSIVNLTPATEAVVGMVLGAAPRDVFASASTNPTVTTTLALLGSATAVTSAATQLKTVLATSLTDLKITDAKGLELLRDETYLANKLGFDAALEGQRIQVLRDSGGRDQLQVSNKLLAPGVVEVRIDLATARTELLKGASGSVAKAISSTLKASTSPLKVALLNLATLDDLSTAVNKRIAVGATASDFLASTLLPNHKFQDGRSRAALAELLAAYAVRNQQLGRWQVTGCLDAVIATTGCARLSVSTLVTDRAGNVVDSLSETVGYSAAVASPGWAFVGNDRLASVRVNAVAQASFSLDGTVQGGTLAPANGMQAVVRTVDFANPPAQAVNSAVLQVPSGYSVPLKYCGPVELCITPNVALTPVASGQLKDTLLQRPTPGWVGNQDATRGAKYTASVSLTGTTPTDVVTAYLLADVPSDLAIGQFVKPDATLLASDFVAGATVSWRNWADAHPDMRVLGVRTIATSAAGTLEILDTPVGNPFAQSQNLPPVATATSGFQLWISALDTFGRRFYSQFSSAF